MKIRSLLLAAVVAAAFLVSSQAEEQEPVGRKLARSIPGDVVLCVRLDLDVVRTNEEAKSILDAARLQFKEKLDSIGQFSGLTLTGVSRIWVNVVKDKEVLVILEGDLDADGILNSAVVTGSRRMARPGTLVAIEMKDEQTNELNHAVLVNEHIVAFGLPRLVDTFIGNYVGGKSGGDANGLVAIDNLTAAAGMFNVTVMHLPEQTIREKPFLAHLVNAQLQLNIVEKSVVATARVTMKDDEKAKALRDLVSGFVVLGLTSEIKVDYPEIKNAVLDGLKLSHEGPTASLSTGVKIELLRNLLRSKGLELK